MAALSYATLTAAKTTDGSLKQWVNRSDLPASHIVSLAEDWCNRVLRFQDMQDRDTIVLAEGDYTIEDIKTSLPGFLDPIQIWVPKYATRLVFKPEEDIDNYLAVDSDGVVQEVTCPWMYTRIGKTLYFDGKADAALDLTVTYYKSPTPLSGSNDTNLYSEMESLFLFLCLGYAYAWVKDLDASGKYFGAATGLSDKINQTEDLVRRGQEIDAEVP